MKNFALLFLLFFSTQVFAQQPSPQEENQIRNLIEDKVNLLWENIGYIADGRNNNVRRRAKITESISLFDTDNHTIVEKSKSGKQTVHNTVTDYLKAIMNRGNNYRVKITQYNSVFIRNLVYNSTCNCYSGYAIIYQKYERYQKANVEIGQTFGKLIYEDRTEKRIEIIVKQDATWVDGEEIVFWDVFLGDVTVDNVY